MVKASRPAASQFSAIPISMTENSDSTTPSARASAPWTLPEGTGRPRVRRILASMSASYHMFREAEAPAPTAMQSTATAARIGLIRSGAQTRPVKAVKITSDMTRGFRSCRKSCQRAIARVSGWAVAMAMTIYLEMRWRSLAQIGFPAKGVQQDEGEKRQPGQRQNVAPGGNRVQQGEGFRFAAGRRGGRSQHHQVLR